MSVIGFLDLIPQSEDPDETNRLEYLVTTLSAIGIVVIPILIAFVINLLQNKFFRKSFFLIGNEIEIYRRITWIQRFLVISLPVFLLTVFLS